MTGTAILDPIPRGMQPAGMPATFVALPNGGAWVTVGEISYPCASAGLAREQLQAREARGEVHVHWRELSS